MKLHPLVLLLLLIGCARYEYDVTHPPEFAQHVGKSDTILAREPLEYKLNTVDNRLVMRIYNRTDSSLTLLGDRSSVVDPDGQSHPLPTMTAAPASFIKLILPPLRPRIERTGPSIGIGVGTVIGDSRHRRYGYGMYDAYEPRYLTVYDNHQLYWDWDGEGSVRLTLVYEENGRTFSHDFTIARKKM